MHDDFPQLVRDYLGRVSQTKAQGGHHDQLRKLFWDFLKDAFPNLDANEVELERSVKGLGVRGYIDALYRDIVFEFKRDLKIERAKGLEELGRYLPAQPEPKRCLGVLTDGQTFEVYVLREGELDKARNFRIEADKPREIWLQLDSLLFSEHGIAPTAEDVVCRFGEQSPVFSQSYQRLHEMWLRVKDTGTVATKFREWNGLLAYAHGSKVGETELFLRHTYLSLLARLMAYMAIVRQLPSSGELAGLVDGEAFRRLGLPNLAEEDFFAWVLEEGVRSEALFLLGGLAQHLSVYEFDALNEDLLKELYQELVDPKTRHDLGEFYTPDWLAEKTLKEAGFGPGQSLLDPACGSGTFLFTAIRLLREAGLEGKELARHAREELAGVDVHPLAVIIARCNFVLALSKELKEPVGEELAIPIFMADGLLEEQQTMEQLIPVPVAGLDEEERYEQNLESTFHLPAQLADEPQKMKDAITALSEMARAGGDDFSARAGLRQRLGELGLSAYSPVFENDLRLLRYLLERGRDSIYAFILRNACQPIVFSRRKFDPVAGNPPWLTYRFISNPDYQDRVKWMATQRHGLVRDQKLVPQIEMAALFFAHAYERYLRGGGSIAFVMPKSVLTGAKQHRRFNERFFPRLVKVLDLEEVSPVFNVPSCVLIARKGDEPQNAQVVVLRGELPRKNASLAEAQRCLEMTPGKLPGLTRERHSLYRDKFIQGATIVPRTLWFVRPPHGALAISSDRPYLETDPSVIPQANPPWKDIRIQEKVEAKFLYATLLGDDLVPFGWRRLRMVVLPSQAGQDGRLRLVDRSEAVRNGWTGLKDWLEKAEEYWQSYKKPTTKLTLLERLNPQNTLTSQSPGALRVVYNKSATYLVACVVDAKAMSGVYDLPVQGFVVEHVLYRYETSAEEEGHYLAALLNAPSLNAAIKPHQTRGSYGERDIHRRPFEVLPNPVPLFNVNDNRHLRLAELSSRCHQRVAQMELSQTRGIGLLRREVRGALKQELTEIDEIARELLGL